ncbi:MAG: hypothetical protein HQM13_22905 [SAR324 cluster bacterium]|nr:hypothetical protein [SAR324 cluster bacterium]
MTSTECDALTQNNYAETGGFTPSSSWSLKVGLAQPVYIGDYRWISDISLDFTVNAGYVKRTENYDVEPISASSLRFTKKAGNPENAICSVR